MEGHSPGQAPLHVFHFPFCRSRTVIAGCVLCTLNVAALLGVRLDADWRALVCFCQRLDLTDGCILLAEAVGKVRDLTLGDRLVQQLLCLRCVCVQIGAKCAIFPLMAISAFQMRLRVQDSQISSPVCGSGLISEFSSCFWPWTCCSLDVVLFHIALLASGSLLYLMSRDLWLPPFAMPANLNS